ncbi:MAG TPA: hypothetical protein VFG68_17730 [Fimbriiglobus sp.]|nr:hypothetical protein [Fimbriiglobus sp.]
MTSWKMLVAAAVAAVGLSSRADAQVSVSIPGVGSATYGNGSTYYSPYTYGNYYTPYTYGSTYYTAPAGFATTTYNYPSYSSYYYPATSNYYSGTGYTYPTYGSRYYYPSYSYNYPSYSGYTYPSYGGYSYYPSYGGYSYYPSYGGYSYPGWGGSNTFGQGLQSGVVQGALGVPNWYGYGGYGGSNVQGTVGNYFGRRLGQAIFR